MLRPLRASTSALLRRSPFPSSPTATSLRLYSFESGPKRKPDGTPKPDSDQVSSSDSIDPKPLAVSAAAPVAGRGRRAGHRPMHAHSAACRAHPKLALPFEPLSADHLAHLRPRTLFLDLFFSLQRPLLEIELSPNDRRSITSESLQAAQDAEPELAAYESEQDDSGYGQIYTGAPSDPAFKPPQPSSARPTVAENELDDESWSTTDPYRPYLVTEPEGVNPAWSAAVKHCLASCRALVPPPTPQPMGDENAQAHAIVKTETSPSANTDKTQETAQDCERERVRRRALEFLAPYGHAEPSEEQPDGSLAAASSERGSLPAISQDPLTLTMQAARFLHSGMTAVRWPSATSWAALNSQLAAAEKAYTAADDAQEMSAPLERLPAVRGEDRPPTAGRRSRHTAPSQWVHIQPDAGGKTLSLSAAQLAQIVKYSEKILRDKVGLESVPKEVVASLERLGQFLIRKHALRSDVPLGVNVPVVVENVTVHMDSVFRKKKRKMKVHKYKKRRKARRTLRKRQGRD